MSLSDMGETLDALIAWDIFRSNLADTHEKVSKNAARRKPTCLILIFKLRILQRLHNLSDERLQFQMIDRLSFVRFLGLDLAGCANRLRLS